MSDTFQLRSKNSTTPTDLFTLVQFAEPEPRLCTVIRNNKFVEVPETSLTEAERRSAYNSLYSPCGGW